MTRLQRTALFLALAIVCAVISTLAFLCIPFCGLSGKASERILSLIVAGVFWGSLILEQVFFWIANTGRKRIQQRAFRKIHLKNASLGLVTFFTSKEARICDLVLGVAQDWDAEYNKISFTAKDNNAVTAVYWATKQYGDRVC